MKGWTKPSGLRFIVEPRTVPLTRERYAIVRDTWTCEDDEYDSIREAYATAARMNANPNWTSQEAWDVFVAQEEQDLLDSGWYDDKPNAKKTAKGIAAHGGAVDAATRAANYDRAIAEAAVLQAHPAAELVTM